MQALFREQDPSGLLMCMRGDFNQRDAKAKQRWPVLVAQKKDLNTPFYFIAGLHVRVLNSTNPGTDLLPTGLQPKLAGTQAEVWALLWQPQTAEPHDTKLLLIVMGSCLENKASSNKLKHNSSPFKHLVK